LRWSEGTAGSLGSRVNAGVRKVEELVMEGSAGMSGIKVDCRCRGARGSSGSCVNAGSSEG
jgi:hypothetical protein